MDPLRLKVNLTTVFMLPMLCDKDLKHYDILTDTFINAYIADLNKPEQDNKLLVRYATITDLPVWTKPYRIYEDEEGTIMVPYDMSDKYINDYAKFLGGDYSKFSESYTDQILKFWEADEYSLLHGVLYGGGYEIENFWKNELGIDTDVISDDTEYWKPPNIKQEIFGMGGE